MITIICAILAAASLAYAAAIWAVHSGTAFWLVWVIIAAIFALIALSSKFGWWTALPCVIRTIIAVIACLALLGLAAIEGCVVHGMRAQASDGLDYIVVLGAQVRADGPSNVLRYRLDKAIDYLEANPNTTCIVSGGQGPNEPFTEAQGMADYLESKGIAANRIIKESTSTSTEENLKNSKQLMREGASVGIVTNNFHMFRALQIAKTVGLDQAEGIAAGSLPFYLPNNMLREAFAEVKFLVRQVF